MPPTPGTTPGAGVTVRYLSVTPPLTPTVSGSDARVPVASPDGADHLDAAPRGHGEGARARDRACRRAPRLSVRMPRHEAGLYVLGRRGRAQSAAVPLVASKAGRSAATARVLVVLPMLTWLGNSPVDDTGDGLPDTLTGGTAAELDRPLVDGLPASLGDDAALLNYLNDRHVDYQLTTDVALAEGRGPSLVDRWGVLFPDGSDFLPASARGGPHRLREGRRPRAGARHRDLRGHQCDQRLSERPGRGRPGQEQDRPVRRAARAAHSTDGALITELQDHLSLFGGTVAFTGFSQYQPIEPPAGVTGLGRRHRQRLAGDRRLPGRVRAPWFEVGLPSFGASLAHNVDSQELLGSDMARAVQALAPVSGADRLQAAAGPAPDSSPARWPAYLKRLVSSLGAYQIASILQKLLAVLLLPVYTGRIAPAGYGIVETLATFVIFASIVVRFGMIESFLRFYFADKDRPRSDALVRTVGAVPDRPRRRSPASCW